MSAMSHALAHLPRRAFGVLTAALVAGLVPLAAVASEEPRRGGTVVAMWQLEPPLLFSPRGAGSTPLLVTSKILEKLVRITHDGGFEPQLATSWSISDDFKTYTFKLREGVTWHDGEPFSSADVAFTVNEYWRKYLGFGPVHGQVESAEAPDANTVVIRYRTPKPEFLVFATLAGAQGGQVIAKHIYEGTDMSRNPTNNAPIGTGPFKFKEWVRGSHVEMVRNENYWDEGKPYLDGLVIRYLRDPGARAAAVEAGEVQVAISNSFARPDILRITDEPGFHLDLKGYEAAGWQNFLAVNLRNQPVADKRVRQAIMHAIDRQFIVDTFMYGLGKVATGPVMTQQEGFYTADVATYPFDPEKAARILDEAGYERGADGKRFAITLLTAPWFVENAKIGPYIKQVLEDIGIGVTLDVADRAGAIRKIYKTYEFDLALTAALASADPLMTTTHLFTTAGIVPGAAFVNASGYSNPELDAIVDEAGVEADPDKRRALLHEFQRIAAEDVPNIFLVEIQMANVVNAKVRNVSSNPMWMYDTWKDLWRVE